MAKVLQENMQLPGNFQGIGVGEKASWRWYGYFLEQDVLYIVSSFDKVCNDISMFLNRAKCEGRRAKKQRSGDHVC